MNKFANISAEDMKIISKAEAELADTGEKKIALVAYDLNDKTK